MSIIAGTLHIVKSRVGYKRSFEHDSLELSTEDVEGRCSTKWWRQSVPGTCCRRRERTITECETASSRTEECQCVSRAKALDVT